MRTTIFKRIIFDDFIETNIKNKFLNINESNLINGIWINFSKIYSFNNKFILVKNFKEDKKVEEKIRDNINFFIYDINNKGFKYHLGLVEIFIQDNEFIC